MFAKIRKTAIVAASLLSLALTASISTRAQAPDFSFRAIDGETVTSQSVRGEVVVLAFGASWLPLTQNQMEGVKKLADQYAGRGVVAYWVSTDSESPKSKNYVGDDELRALARKYKVTVLRDPDGVISKKLGVDQLPSVVIVDKQGNIAGAIGGLDPKASMAAQLAARLDKIL
jgi:peroxiredoxin